MRLSDIKEAVSHANQGVAMTKIVSYLEKQLGKKMTKLTTEKFKNSAEKGIGVRYVFDGSVLCVRFNWAQGKSSEVTSVDVWTGSGRDPNFHITWKGKSLAQSLPALARAIKAPKIGEMTGAMKAEKEAVTEAKKGKHPKHPSATYDPELSDKTTAGFTTGDGEQYYCRRSLLPDDHPNKKQDLNEAKKGEFTERSSINDMIEKLEQGRSFNRSEFIMNYHPENAHAYDDWVEKNKDQLVTSGKRISLAKGAKFQTQAPVAATSGVGATESGGSVTVSKGGNGEEYDVAVPDEGRVSYNDSLEHLEGLTQGLIKGSFNALFVAGKGGTGKTQTVEDVLQSNGLSDGKGFFKITGSASPIGIYTALYKYRDDIILFDDCDGALESQDGRNIIKAATDTKKTRKIAWSKKSAGMFDPDSDAEVSKRDAKAAKDAGGADSEEGDDLEDDSPNDKVPTHFIYTGQVIFISNLPLNKLDPDGALRTRAFIIAIDPTPDEIIERMEQIVGTIKLEGDGKLSDKQRMEVLNVIKAGRRKDQASLRTLVRALNLAASGAPNWQKLVQLYA